MGFSATFQLAGKSRKRSLTEEDTEAPSSPAKKTKTKSRSLQGVSSSDLFFENQKLISDTGSTEYTKPIWRLAELAFYHGDTLPIFTY